MRLFSHVQLNLGLEWENNDTFFAWFLLCMHTTLERVHMKNVHWTGWQVQFIREWLCKIKYCIMRRRYWEKIPKFSCSNEWVTTKMISQPFDTRIDLSFIIVSFFIRIHSPICEYACMSPSFFFIVYYTKFNRFLNRNVPIFKDMLETMINFW